MDAHELRRAWTDFWTARDHTDVESAGLIPHHPSAPMFTTWTPSVVRLDT